MKLKAYNTTREKDLGSAPVSTTGAKQVHIFSVSMNSILGATKAQSNFNVKKAQRDFRNRQRAQVGIYFHENLLGHFIVEVNPCSLASLEGNIVS